MLGGQHMVQNRIGMTYGGLTYDNGRSTKALDLMSDVEEKIIWRTTIFFTI